MNVRTSLNATIFREKAFNVNGELTHYLRRMNLEKLRVLILKMIDLCKSLFDNLHKHKKKI